jgi:drug/metabolite transporter (DMT)-like permease
LGAGLAGTMVFVLALAAALANALTSVFQRKGIEAAPQATTLRFSLITYAVRRGIWLAGFGLMIISFLLQAVALHLGRLSEVQPILTTELVFLVIVLVAWFGFKMGGREWTGVVAVTAGLAGFLAFADPVDGTLSPPLWEWLIAGGACTGGIVIATALALRGPRWWRAAMFGTAASISFAFTAACTKVVSGFAASDLAGLYRHWQTYALACFGALAVFLAQNAIHAGPIVASQSTIVLVDPVASILVGVGLFGDDLRTSGAWGPLEALSLLVMVAGAVLLAHSPLVAGLKSGSDQYSEILSHHPQSGGMSDAACPGP